MPYINKEDRDYFEELELSMEHYYIKNPGQLNYLFTLLIKQYIEQNKENYQTYNDIIGALESCKQELYRRKISPYEDRKIIENGDVY